MIFGIPFQVFTGVFGFITSFLAKRTSDKMAIEAAERKHTLELLSANTIASTQHMKASLELAKADKYFSFTRKTLALGLTFGTMFAIFLIPVLFPSIPWIFEQDTVHRVFFGLFELGSTTELVQKVGIPVIFAEAMLHIVTLIATFYFGNRAGQVKSPYL